MAAAGRHRRADIDLDGAEATAVVLLVDENWSGDPAWVDWAPRISDEADRTGLRALVFPVAIDGSGIAMGVGPEQAVSWDRWGAEPEGVKRRRLCISLSHQFCRMLRHYLEHVKRPGVSDDDLLAYLRRVVLLSHSKHDRDGMEIALQFRQFIQDAGYDAFFDVFDIPIGLRFNRVLLETVRVSSAVAIHMDSYSKREWCRREMIEAKLSTFCWSANIEDVDQRGFPYMANTDIPNVRMIRRKGTASTSSCRA